MDPRPTPIVPLLRQVPIATPQAGPATRHLAGTVVGVLAFAACSGAWAQDASTAPRGEGAGARSWLLEPRPSDPLRDMSTDRPDTTESPYTLDAGHFQVELSLVDFVHDSRNSDGVKRRTLSFAPMLIKAGILDNFDLQLGIDPLTRERQTDDATGVRTTTEGFGDLTLRGKVNLWGNDGGQTAFAIMPFIKFPTARGALGNGKVEGGLILPLGVDLGHDLSLGLMQELDFVRVDGTDHHTIDWVHTVTLGFPIAGDLGGYVEYAGFANLNHAEEYRGYANAGLTYALTPDVQLDAGTRVGLTRAADDLGLFLGISWRY